jgi:hypothetical protein
MIRERLVLLCLEVLVVEVTMEEIGHHLKRLKHDFDLKYILPCVEDRQVALEAVLWCRSVNSLTFYIYLTTSLPDWAEDLDKAGGEEKVVAVPSG